MSIATLQIILISGNFYAAEYIYDNYLLDLFSMNETMLHNFFKVARNVIENSVYRVFYGVFDLFLALIAGFIPKLPSFIRIPLDFIGVTGFLEQAKNKFDNFQSYQEMKIKKEKEMLEKAKNIEANRPVSPSKKDKGAE